FIVRPTGGAAMAGKYTTSFNNVNFEPNTAFAAGTTYEVVINGIKDWAGNAMTTAFNASFTIAGTGATPPANCNLGTDTVKYVGNSVPAPPTSCTGSPTPTCTFDFGDGFVSASVACATGTSHTYSAPNHYTLTVHATNSSGETSFSRR